MMGRRRWPFLLVELASLILCINFLGTVHGGESHGHHHQSQGGHAQGPAEYEPSHDQSPRDGWGAGAGGHSQQYHYSSYPQHHESHHTGLALDLGSAKYFIAAVLILFALCALLYPFLGGKGGGGGGWGWEARRWSNDQGTSPSLRNFNVMATTDKVLTAVDRFYNVYSNKKS